MTGAMEYAFTGTWWRFGWARGAFPWVTGYRHLFWRVWWRSPSASAAPSTDESKEGA